MAGRERNVSVVLQARDEASRTLSAFSRNLTGLAGSLTTLAGVAAVAGAAIGALGAVMAKAVAAASDQEKADLRLAVALQSVGQNTQAARRDLSAFIDEQEDATKVSDEQIASVISLLAQFGRLSGQELKRATRAVLDYSAALGQDAVGSAEQLINVIVRGTGRMTGINTRFAEGTSNAEKFASVLRQLEDATGGSAKALADTWQGALKQSSIELERLLEQLGNTVVLNKAARDAVMAFAEFLRISGQFIAENREELQGLVTVIARVAEATIKALPTMLRWAKILLSITPGVGGLISGLSTLWGMLDKVASETIDVGEAAAGAGANLDKLGRQSGAAAVGAKAAAQETAAAAESLDAFVQVVGEADSALERIGFGALGEFIDRARDATAAVSELQLFTEAGLVSERFAQSANQHILSVIDQLRQLGVAIESPFTRGQELAIELTATIEQGLVQGAYRLGDALVDAAAGAGSSFKEFAKQALVDLAKMILRALIFRAIMQAISGGTSAAPVGIPLGGGVVGAQHGGEVRGGIPGLDSVLAMLTPGEIVLPERLASDFQAFAETMRERSTEPGAGPSKGDTFQLLARIEPRRDREADAIEIIEDINRLVERRGYRLTASEVLA